MSALGNYYSSQNSTNNRYEYIINQNDLIRAFNDSRNNLNYALLKESKRQRFLIANSRGLQEKFFRMINKDISKANNYLEKTVAADLYGYLMAAIHGGSYTPKSSGMDLGQILGRALGNTIVSLTETLWKN